MKLELIKTWNEYKTYDENHITLPKGKFVKNISDITIEKDSKEECFKEFFELYDKSYNVSPDVFVVIKDIDLRRDYNRWVLELEEYMKNEIDDEYSKKDF